MKVSAFDIALVSVSAILLVVFAARFVSAFREASRRERNGRRTEEEE